MSKVEKMHIADIINITNLYITPPSFLEIWKQPEELTDNLDEKPVVELLQENPDYIYELFDNEYGLYAFLTKYDNQIDKPRFLMRMLLDLKERFAMTENVETESPDIRNMKMGMNAIKMLLKDVDRTCVFYNTEGEFQKVLDLAIINCKEELAGIDRKKKNTNIKRLKELQKDTHLGNIVQALCLSDIEDIITFEKEIGFAIKDVIQYNMMLERNVDSTEGIEKEEDKIAFITEMTRMLDAHIEEINFDAMLLCSAYRYMSELEAGRIHTEEIKMLKNRIDIIKKHIKKNIKIDLSPDEKYSTAELDRDSRRFIGEDDVTYISKEQEEQIVKHLLDGKTTLDWLGEELVQAIYLQPTVLTQILRYNPNNYIFFLKQNKCEYSKKIIIKDILNTQICSEELLQALCENTDITSEEILDLFEREIISVSHLKNVREQVGTIITNEKLFEKYKKYKQKTLQGQDSDIERIQLERYALAYRNTELIGKEESEIQEKGEEFVSEILDEIESSDIMQLYRFNIIPLKVSVDWGGEEIIEELLENESLKPADAKYLRNEGLLNENVIERIFKKCSQMSYAYQVSLVYAVFDGQTSEEKEIVERLAQYYHIENGITNSSGKKGNGRIIPKEPVEKSERKIKMRDPGAKYNLLAAIDNDVKIEEGIIDGHIIFHYPNIGDGTVLIEKLHKITSNKQNGSIEIKPDNQSATYVLSEEEFIKMKSILIQNGKIDRTELTQRWWVERDAEHWIPHTGTRGWENALKQRFSLDSTNPQYIQEDLAKIEQLIEKSIESKRDER